MNPEPFTSLGHPPGTYQAQIYVSPEARQAYLALPAPTELPQGALIAERLADPTTGAAGPIYAMRKTGTQAWEYLLVRPDGTIAEQGALELCVRCHAEAVADSLFGIPLDSHPPATSE